MIGCGVGPGASVAVPLGEGMAIGGGIAYSSTAPYALLAFDTAEYAPGSETLITAGLDPVVGSAVVGVEGAYARYAEDRYREAAYRP